MKQEEGGDTGAEVKGWGGTGSRVPHIVSLCPPSYFPILLGEGVAATAPLFLFPFSSAKERGGLLSPSSWAMATTA